MQSRFGRGGFAVASRARQPAFERFVAVKIFGEIVVDSGALATFQRKCRAIPSFDMRATFYTQCLCIWDIH